MSTTPIDFSSIGGRPVSAAPIDFSSIGGKPVEPTAQPVSGGTIGPQKSWHDIFSQSADAPVISQALDKLSQISNFTPEGQQDHPIQSAIGQTAARMKQMLFGGQGGGLNMQTGFLNNPVTSSLVGGPGEASAAASGIEKAAAAPGEAVEAVKGGIQAVKEAMPAAKMAAAGQKFQELSGAIGNHTVAMTDRLGNALTDVKQAVDTGSTLPSVINKFVTRIADVDKGPLTYDEARQFYSNVSDLSASERMAAKAKDLRVIQEFKHALGDTIADTADQGGLLAKYQDAMKGFATGAQRAQQLENIKDKAVQALGPAVLGTAGWKGLSYLKSLAGH